MSMFYSQLLLSKKGPFGTIWVAAHCHKKLKKDQIIHTNISASVDKILKDGVPAITYRILAFLLLGVVRIFSKKVEYLFHDCRGVLTEICQFTSRKQQASRNLELEGTCVPESTRKKRATTSNVKAICAPYSVITIPERFELDSFDLGLVDDDARRDHVKSREDITLKDPWEYGRRGHHSLEKDCFIMNNVTFEDYHETFSPQPDFRRNPSPASMEKLRDDNRFLLEDRLDPMILTDDEEESELGGVPDKDHGIGGDHMKFPLPEMMVEERSEQLQGDGSPASMEKVRDDNRFLLEDRLDPMVLSQGVEESGFEGVSDKGIGGAHVKFSLPEMIVEERSEIQGDGSSYGTQLMNVEKAMSSEMSSEVTEKQLASQDQYPVSITIDATPESKMTNILDAGPTSKTGAITPESMAVRTPAVKERPRLSRKRQCTFDETIVVPNKVYKGWINDCSDLVCKRRKVPHTIKHVRKVDRMSNLPQCFLEPLIPIPIDLKSLTSKKKLEVLEPVETSQRPAKSDDVNLIKTTIGPAIADVFGSPSRGFPEEEIIAPSTPVTRSTSVRFSELRVTTTKSNEVGPTSSHESTEKNLSPCGNRDLDTVLIDEEDVNSNGEIQQNDKWSARTRNVAGYLHKNFEDRKKKSGKEEALSLFQVLKGKTKKESARLFYELLVMKTGGYVDVKQEKAYSDISVTECQKLKKACEADVS